MPRRVISARYVHSAVAARAAAKTLQNAASMHKNRCAQPYTFALHPLDSSKTRILLMKTAASILTVSGLLSCLAPAFASGPTDAQIASIVVTANQVDIDAGKYV